MIYFLNNIGFRLESSKAISKFKMHEVWVLDQLINQEYKFTQTSREIILLKFSLWTEWILEIEGFLAHYDQKTVTKEDLNHIVHTSDIVARKYESALNKQHEVFERETIDAWIEVHSLAYMSMKTGIKELGNMCVKDVFFKIVEILIDVMLMALYELYEIENIQFHNKHIMSILDFNVKYMDQFGVCLAEKRADVYDRSFGEGKYIVHNYSQQSDESVYDELIKHTDRFSKIKKKDM